MRTHTHKKKSIDVIKLRNICTVPPEEAMNIADLTQCRLKIIVKII